MNKILNANGIFGYTPIAVLEKKHLDRYHTHVRRGFSKISPEVSLQWQDFITDPLFKRRIINFLVFYKYIPTKISGSWVFKASASVTNTGLPLN